MGLKDKAIDRAILKQEAKGAQARAKYYQYVMKEENCTLDEARDICAGRTDPQRPEYMVGFKICNPYIMTALFISEAEVREAYQRHIEEDMTPEEIRLFREEVLTKSTGELFTQQVEIKAKQHKAKKEAKKAAKAAKKSHAQ